MDVYVIDLIDSLATQKLTAGQEDFIYVTAKALQFQKTLMKYRDP